VADKAFGGARADQPRRLPQRFPGTGLGLQPDDSISIRWADWSATTSTCSAAAGATMTTPRLSRSLTDAAYLSLSGNIALQPVDRQPARPDSGHQGDHQLTTAVIDMVQRAVPLRLPIRRCPRRGPIRA
jgi:hypothetical protein